MWPCCRKAEVKFAHRAISSLNYRFLCTVPHTGLQEFLVNVRKVCAFGVMLMVVYGKTQGDYLKPCKGTS